MRYIRTKDKIIEVNNWYKKGYAYCEEDGVWKTPNQQADTIEELCDEFVVYDIHKNKYLNFIHLKSLIGYCEENGLDKTAIKGAIWTDKGLIYVAKMNEKGELELL